MAEQLHERDPDTRIIDLLRNPETNDQGTNLLFAEYWTVCLAMARRLALDPTLSEDLASFSLQEFALRERDNPTFERGRALKPYLQTIVRNAYLDHQRRCKKQPVHVSIDDAASDDGSSLSILDQLIVEEGNHAVQSCLQQLGSGDLELILARFGDDAQTLASLAAERDVAISTVSDQIKKAKARLKSLLERAGMNGALHGR